MTCENHRHCNASGLYRVPYLGRVFRWCASCVRGAERDFGAANVQRVLVSFDDGESTEDWAVGV